MLLVDASKWPGGAMRSNSQSRCPILVCLITSCCFLKARQTKKSLQASLCAAGSAL